MSACLYDHLCGGCDRPQWISAERKSHLLCELSKWANTPSIDFGYHAFGEWSLRDRVDLTLDSSSGTARLGLYAKTWGERELIDLPGCPQLSPALESWLRDFRRDLPPLEGRGSVRLRVSPSGLRGVWLDFANIDLKKVLDEEAWLNRQATQSVIVEMGQRRKRAQRDDSRWRLVDPRPEAWFETWLSRPSGLATHRESSLDLPLLSPHPLYGKIASFTQPSRAANRELIRLALRDLHIEDHALELGSGIGNFTLPMASRAKSVTCWENDRSALEDLHFNLERAQLLGQVQIQAVDFIRGLHSESMAESMAESWAGRGDGEQPRSATPNFILVDPPRAGLGDFAETLAKAQGPLSRLEKISYVSCYPESWARDLRILNSRGWKLIEAHLIDQFPRTRHYEIVSHLRRG